MTGENKKYSLKKFFTNLGRAYKRLFITNLFVAIPLLLCGGSVALEMYLTGGTSIFVINIAFFIFALLFPALAYVCKKAVLGEELKPAKDFFAAFKENIVFSLINSVIVYIVALGFSISFMFYQAVNTEPIMILSLIMSIFLVLVFLMLQFSMNVMAATVDIKISRVIKNSVLLLGAGFFGHLKTLLSLFLVFIAMFSIIIVTGSPIASICTAALLIALGLPVFISYIIVFNTYNTVEKTVIEPFRKEEEKRRSIEEDPIEKLDYETLVSLSKGDPEEYVSIGGKMIRRKTIEKIAMAHKDKG